MVNKKFDKKLFTQNDPKSREIAKKFFQKLGIELIDHPNQFAIDLITKDNSFQLELEHRHSWKSGEFPFDEVNLPRRKKDHFIKSDTSHYCILSKDYSWLGIVHNLIIKSFIKPRFLKEHPNKFVKKDEYFYKIPKKSFLWFKIK